MKHVRTGLIVLGGLAAVGGAYVAGQQSGRSTQATPETPPAVMVGQVIVPNGEIKLPAEAYPLAPVENPTGVLLGEIRPPTDLLTTQPSPKNEPQFIVPNLK
jgi:hypothetical protein